jgi:hypothetical protein
MSNWCADRCKRIGRYMLAQLKEPSTYRGAILIATAMGMKFTPSESEAIVVAGLLAAGLVGVIFTDGNTKKVSDIKDDVDAITDRQRKEIADEVLSKTEADFVGPPSPVVQGAVDHADPSGESDTRRVAALRFLGGLSKFTVYVARMLVRIIKSIKAPK